MICSQCTAKCSTSKNGLCVPCRKSAYRPQLLQKLRRKAMMRWTWGENAVLLTRYNVTPRQAIDRSVVAVRMMEKYFERDTIYAWGLDNPFMAAHARKTMAAMVQDHLAARGARKPVMSVTRTGSVREVAA